MKLNRIDRIETSNILKTQESKDISKIIIKQSLNNNLYNISVKKSGIFYYISKLKNIILFSTVISIVVGTITFSVLYYRENNIKTRINYIQIRKNNTDNIDGYYIPKDKLSNSFYKKCSVENCKKCYGNSNNDTCLSCLNSFYPIRNDNNKIISCEKINNNLTLNQSDFIDSTNINIIESESKTYLETDNININTINTELITNYIMKNFSESANISNTNNIQDYSTIITLESTYDYSQQNIITNELKTIIETNSSNITEINMEINTQKVTNIITQTTHITQVEPITTTSIVIHCEPGYYLHEENNKECKPCSIL